MEPAGSSLLTDLYQLNMLQAYLESRTTEEAAFEFFARKLPPTRNFYVAAGLEQAVEYLERAHFSASDIDWLRQTGKFGTELLDYLGSLRFTGDVYAIPEGTVFFPDEPILRVSAPLPQAQLVETRLINILHFQSLIATKAVRQVLQARGKTLVDFGLRRAHGAEAGVMAARASYIAGFTGTATVLAGKLFDVPIFGTMAHSFVQAFDDEVAAFEAFAAARPDNLVFLIDTYDTYAAARKVVQLAPKLMKQGIRIKAVRIDSGDLKELAKGVRQTFDEAGLQGIEVFVSGGLDEHDIAAILDAQAPVDGFGVGTSLTTSADLPALDCAYKLVEYAGIPRRKRSTGKATLPGRKQVWRQYDTNGRMIGDVLSLDSDQHEGAPLMECVMRGGRRVAPPPSMEEIRANAAKNLSQLPVSLRGLEADHSYRVEIGDALKNMIVEVDQREAENTSE